MFHDKEINEETYLLMDFQYNAKKCVAIIQCPANISYISKKK